MKTNQLNCLIAVAEHGSVRMAALKLGKSATAVSNALRELEREVGSVLINRMPDGVYLTDAGRALASHARLIVHQIRQAKDEIQMIQSERSTHLAMTVTPWMTVAIVGPAISIFRRRCLGVRVQISEHLGMQYPLLREGKVDLSFGPKPTEDQLQYLEAKPMFVHTHAIVARVGHPALDAKSWDELRGYDWIVTTGIRNLSPLLLHKVLVDMNAGVQRVHYTDSGLTCISMVRATDMLSLVPWPMVEMPGVRSMVAALNLLDDSEPITMCLITRKNDILSRSANVFLECLEEVKANFEISNDHIVRRMSSVVEHIDVDL